MLSTIPNKNRDIYSLLPLVGNPEYNTDTKTVNSIDSDYAILIDIENNKVLADKNGTQRISPASLTKLMTLVVAVENIDDFEDTKEGHI